VDDVLSALVLARGTSEYQMSGIKVVVRSRFTHIAAPQNYRVVEQVALNVGCVLQLISEVANHLREVPCQYRIVVAPFEVFTVVRLSVVADQHPAFRVDPGAGVTGKHHRRNAGDVALEGRDHQIPV